MDIQDRIISFFKEHTVAVVLGIVGILAMGYGVFGLSGDKPADDSILFESAQDSGMAEASGSAKQKIVLIDVSGAVENPGVYELPEESRVQDALISAGGMSEDADRQRIAQEINLAAPLTDGAKLYIPFVGDSSDAALGGSSGNTSSGSTLGSTSTRINVNTASETELDTLPGIGPVTAQKIIDNRPYQAIEELLEKKAVGQSVFEKIKEQVSVY